MDPSPPPGTTGFDPARLIREHQVGVWRYLRALGCEANEAEDLTQETFLSVLQRPFEDYHSAATGAYLRRAARNLFISHRRRAGRMQVVEEIDEVDASWEAWFGKGGDEALDFLRECLTRLTERARWSLEMRYRDQKSREEIAAALQITEHGAKNLMQRAKQQLRECVERKLK